MKRVISIILLIILISALTGCTETTDENSYEMMTAEAINGNYLSALEYYNDGGADDPNSADWYFYSVAMNDYVAKGCLGYSYDLLTKKCSSSFTLANKKAAEIKDIVSGFDGAYKCGRNYLYIQNGKIAVNNGAHLLGNVYCTDEIAIKDGTYYWSTHSVDGEDVLRYKLTLTDSGVTVTAVDEANNMYAGEYVTDYSEIPELTY